MMDTERHTDQEYMTETNEAKKTEVSAAEQAEKPAEQPEQMAEQPEQPVPETQKKVRRAEKRLSYFQRFVIQVLIFVLIMYVMFAHIVGLMTMPNGDMYPRIDGGDLLLFYRLDKEPKSQDIIAFIKNDTQYVGRVVAAGGDTIEITDEGSVLVNGNSLIESNIFYETYRLEGYTKYPLELKENECFVLADSRRGAEDSRYFGPVKEESILGTVITVMRRNNL